MRARCKNSLAVTQPLHRRHDVTSHAGYVGYALSQDATKAHRLHYLKSSRQHPQVAVCSEHPGTKHEGNDARGEMALRRMELLLICVLAACGTRLCHGQLEAADATILASLRNAHANVEAQSFYKIKKNDVESFELSGENQPSIELVDTGRAELVFRQTEGEEGAGFFGSVSIKRNRNNIAFDVLMDGGDVFIKLKEGIPEDAKNIWFSSKDEALADLTKNIPTAFKLTEVTDSIQEAHVTSVKKVEEKLKGDLQSTLCYEITPSPSFQASKASQPDFRVVYSSTYCIDTKTNLLARVTSNTTESGSVELDNGDPGPLTVQVMTEIEFLDFGAQVDFPKLDLSGFSAGDEETVIANGSPGAPGADGGSKKAHEVPGGRKIVRETENGDVVLVTGTPGDSSALRNNRVAFVFLGLSILAFI